MNELVLSACDEDAMVALGGRLGRACEGRGIVFLHGGLGAGKTTFSRGVVRAYGHRGAVKSPTYTLVEPYEMQDANIYHFDLYRLGHPEELEYLGIRDYFDGSSLCLVEWPEKGADVLVAPDLDVAIEICDLGRILRLRAGTQRGQGILARLAACEEMTVQKERNRDES